jgi:hypothetical protein
LTATLRGFSISEWSQNYRSGMYDSVRQAPVALLPLNGAHQTKTCP